MYKEGKGPGNKALYGYTAHTFIKGIRLYTWVSIIYLQCHLLYASKRYCESGYLDLLSLSMVDTVPTPGRASISTTTPTPSLSLSHCIACSGKSSCFWNSLSMATTIVGGC